MGVERDTEWFRMACRGAEGHEGGRGVHLLLVTIGCPWQPLI